MNLERRIQRNLVLGNVKLKKMLKQYRKIYNTPISINRFMVMLVRRADAETTNA